MNLKELAGHLPYGLRIMYEKQIINRNDNLKEYV